MRIESWWPTLTPSSRELLIENNGDEVPEDVANEIIALTGQVPADVWWVGEGTAGGFYLSDEASDWVEAVANGETPEAHG